MSGLNTCLGTKTSPDDQEICNSETRNSAERCLERCDASEDNLLATCFGVADTKSFASSVTVQKDESSSFEITNELSAKKHSNNKKKEISEENGTAVAGDATANRRLAKTDDNADEVKAPRIVTSFSIDAILGSDKKRGCGDGGQKLSSKSTSVSSVRRKPADSLTLAAHRTSVPVSEDDANSSCSPLYGDTFWSQPYTNFWHQGLVNPLYLHPYGFGSFGNVSPTTCYPFFQLPLGTSYPSPTPTMNGCYFSESPLVEPVLMTDVRSNYVTVMFDESEADRCFFCPR